MERGNAARARGAYQNALHDFDAAVRLASDAHDMREEALAMNREAGCFIFLFQYRQALAVINAAADLGSSLHDDEIIGVSENNRATIYEQLGDFDLAEDAAKKSVDHFAVSRNKRYYAYAVTNYGDILSLSHKSEAATLAFRQAIAIANANGMPDAEATAQDRMGEALMEAGDFAAAAGPLDRAYKLEESTGDRKTAEAMVYDLAVDAKMSGNYRHALAILDRADTTRAFVVGGLAPYFEPMLRGQCLLGLGHEQEALAQFEKGVLLAGKWRRSSLPSDASSSLTLARLHEVYSNYIELAAGLAVRHHTPALSRHALSVLMVHRASSLREQMIATLDRQMNLPPLYFELLSQIQEAQAAVTLGAAKDLDAKRVQLQRLKTRLIEVENNIGLTDPNPSSASATGIDEVARVQRKLLRQELLLSFFLGKEKSYLWAITNDKVGVYELPSEDAISADARAFSQAARAGSYAASAQKLRQDLIARLEPEFRNRPEWILAADGALLDGIPFSALPEKDGPSEPLTVAHSLRFTPSELLLTQEPSRPTNTRFVGVADPVYNLADNRISLPRKARSNHPHAGITLARLIASEQEVRTATAGTGFENVAVLTGASATGQRLRQELNSAPEVLHFAVHVISPETGTGVLGEDAGLALSLGTDGLPELLTKEFISTLRVPGALVVMSGCASQQGKPLPSAGMIGLSRAWLLAGAAAVLVTAWPTPDDSGQFFGNFYNRLQSQPKTMDIARRAALALQGTQIDMQRSSGYTNQPSFWAAYSLITKE